MGALIKFRRHLLNKPKGMLFLFVFLLGIVFLSKRSNVSIDFKATKINKRKILDWIVNGQLMELQEENKTRCAGSIKVSLSGKQLFEAFILSVENLGCFTLLRDASPSKIDNGMSLNSCFEFCFQSGGNYAGLTQKGQCYCSATAAKHVSTRLCDVACSADTSKDCAHASSIRLYRKKQGCFKGISHEALSSYIAGSMRLPVNLTGSMTSWKNSIMTETQCLLKCESLGNTLALPIIKDNACLCSDLKSMFPSPEEMQEVIHSRNSLDSEERFHFYYTNIDECRPKRFLKRKEGPYMILTSFWGSGNTWLRHLIEAATGIYTGSAYMDEHLDAGGMIGEKLFFLSGRTIIIKDHIMSKPDKVCKKYKSAILILRNPYDASLAEYARLKTHNNHTSVLDPTIYESAGFKASVKVLPSKWLYHANMLFTLIPNVLVVYYEDLVENPVRELRRVVSFLPQNIVPQGEALNKQLLCMNLDLTGNFKRAPKGLKTNPYDAELRKLYDEAIEKMDNLLQSKEKAPLPRSYYEKWHEPNLEKNRENKRL